LSTHNLLHRSIELPEKSDLRSEVQIFRHLYFADRTEKFFAFDY